jgi:hypothetical protein
MKTRSPEKMALYNANRRARQASMPVCSIDGCDRSINSNGLCSRHYHRQRRYGDPLGGGGYRDGERLRFFEQAKEYLGDECLIWPYGTSGGRAYITNPETKVTCQVSRLLCEHAHGPPPTPYHEAAHSCGKGHLACIAINHLRWATRKENNDDKKIHGTVLRGERVPGAKLSEAKVVEIRKLWSAGLAKPVIAERFGVWTPTISDIVSGKTWAHIPFPIAPTAPPENEPYALGCDARNDFKAIDENPYEHGSEEHQDWAQGWADEDIALDEDYDRKLDERGPEDC